MSCHVKSLRLVLVCPPLQCFNLGFTHFLFFLVLSGTCSSALQGAAGEARRATEEGGRAAAGGDQSLGFLFLWAGGLPHALHHSGADFCLTFRNVYKSWILPVRRCHTAVIRWATPGPMEDLWSKLPLWVINHVTTLPPKSLVDQILYLHLSQVM